MLPMGIQLRNLFALMCALNGTWSSRNVSCQGWVLGSITASRPNTRRNGPPMPIEEHQDIKDSLDGRKFLEKHLDCPGSGPGQVGPDLSWGVQVQVPNGPDLRSEPGPDPNRTHRYLNVLSFWSPLTGLTFYPNSHRSYPDDVTTTTTTTTTTTATHQ